MAQRQERYFIGPRLRDKLRDVIARSDGLPQGSGGSAEVPAVHQEIPRRAGSPVRLGKTSSAWNKGTTATINVWEDGTPPSETQTAGKNLQNCVNKFANVASGKWVILALAGNGYWYLIAAECP
jgi:hypothetical protein